MAAAASLVSPGAAIDLVRADRPAASIVIPVHPLAVESYAAQELQYHVRASTGALLPIVSEGSPIPPGARVYLGGCQATKAAGVSPLELPGNGYVARTIGGNLHLAGKDGAGNPLDLSTQAGTLFGVYDLLEANLGVRWLWPGKLGEVIPRRDSLSIPALDAHVKPLLWFKVWRVPRPPRADTGAAAFGKDQAIWLRRQRFGRSISVAYGHAFGDYWRRFGQTHPEYLARLPDGTRGMPPGGNPQGVHLCVSEPGLWRQIIQDWAARGAPEFLNICENDGYASCTDAKCMSWDEPDPAHPGMRLPWDASDQSMVTFDGRLTAAKDRFFSGAANWPLALGSLSDRYAKFWKTMAEEATRIRPDATVVSYIYDNYRRPPVKAKLSQHVLAGLVPEAFFPYTKTQSNTFRADWAGWSATGCQLFLRPNYTLQGHNFPVSYARTVGEDLKFALAHAMVGADFDSLTGQYATQGPSLYMIAAILNHPEASVDAVVDEFCSAFGPAGGTVKEYFDHWDVVYSTITAARAQDLARASLRYARGRADWRYFFTFAARIYTPQIMSRGRAILERARREASGDPVALARVEWLAQGLAQIDLVLAAEKAYEHFVDTGEGAEFTRARQQLEDFRSRNWNSCLSNFAFLRSAESRLWDAATPPARVPR